MANNVNKKTIEGKNNELSEALVYKHKYENLMDDICDFNIAEMKDVDPKFLEGIEGTEEEKLEHAKKNPGIVLKALKNTCDD